MIGKNNIKEIEEQKEIINKIKSKTSKIKQKTIKVKEILDIDKNKIKANKNFIKAFKKTMIEDEMIEDEWRWVRKYHDSWN